jgi:hypothetical protein
MVLPLCVSKKKLVSTVDNIEVTAQKFQSYVWMARIGFSYAWMPQLGVPPPIRVK